MRIAAFIEHDDGRMTAVMIPPEVMGPVTLTVAQAITAFDSFTPSFRDIRRANASDDKEFAADVRTAEASASFLVLGVAALLSVLTHSKFPLLVGFVVCLLLTMMYEYILTGRPFANA